MSDTLVQEWTLQQTQYDLYERSSLIIKLFSVATFLFLVSSNHLNSWALMVIISLWLQDAIWKTFQSRIEERLLKLELAMAGDSSAASVSAFQFNREFAKHRPSIQGLLIIYAKQGCRPTVAFPHVVLMGLFLVCWFGQ